MSILGKYQIIEELGRGKFGIVYKGLRVKDQEPVAIKMENVYNDSNAIKLLMHETTILNFLHRNGCKTTPAVFWYGIYQDNPTLIIPYYSCSLDQYLNSGSTINPLSIFAQLLEILGNVHIHGVIHRDIKPQNIMVKNGDFYLIDFGLATFYLDENYTHVPYVDSREYILGTPKYTSYNIHLGIEPYRRDDLISLGYMMLSFYCDLPWTSTNICTTSPTTILNNEILYAKNHIMHPVNLERTRLKSWANVESILKLSPLNETIQTIFVFLDKCYKLNFDSTIDDI